MNTQEVVEFQAPMLPQWKRKTVNKFAEQLWKEKGEFLLSFFPEAVSCFIEPIPSKDSIFLPSRFLQGWFWGAPSNFC